jgi:hypothetical protein
MNNYLLLTGLKRPLQVRSHLATSMADFAKVSEILPDSVRVDFGEGTDPHDDSDRNRVISLIMKAVTDCAELNAQMGLFTD